MERYNYIEHLKEDINNFIEENKNLSFDELYDTMFTSDTITGNAYGSYSFSTWKAEENICHNQELLIDALTEFGYSSIPLDMSAETKDVLIRCYLLDSALNDVLVEKNETY